MWSSRMPVPMMPPMGKSAEPEAQQVDQHDPGPEDGRADADQREDHRAVVERRGAVRRGDHAGRDADDQGDQQRGDAQLDRGAEELAQLAGDRLVGAHRVAEIEGEGRLQEVGVLDRQGPVETELLADALDLLDAPFVAGHGDGRVAGDQLQQHEDRGHDPEQAPAPPGAGGARCSGSCCVVTRAIHRLLDPDRTTPVRHPVG